MYINLFILFIVIILTVLFSSSKLEYFYSRQHIPTASSDFWKKTTVLSSLAKNKPIIIKPKPKKVVLECPESDNSGISAFSKYCDSFTESGSIGSNYITDNKDLYGFQRTIEEMSKIKRINKINKPVIEFCPIKIPSDKAGKLIKAGQFRYIIDTRSKEERKRGYIPSSIFLEDFNQHSKQKVKSLNGISKDDFILVYSSTPYKSFMSATDLKKYGNFNNVFFVSDGTFTNLLNNFNKAKYLNNKSCVDNFGHSYLCDYAIN